jgi:hypothetical protein
VGASKALKDRSRRVFVGFRASVSLRCSYRTLVAVMVIGAAPTWAEPLQGNALRQNFHGSAPPTLVANAVSQHDPDAIIFALMSGKCTSFRIEGRRLKCRAVAFFQTEDGRANYTVAVDDPVDDSHTVTFSGDNGRRAGDLYELPIDRMQLKSKDRPKADGLPVPLFEASSGLCKQNGNFVTRQMSAISCTAISLNGKKYELEYQSDGSPMEIKRIKRTRIGPAPISPFDEK